MVEVLYWNITSFPLHFSNLWLFFNFLFPFLVGYEVILFFSQGSRCSLQKTISANVLEILFGAIKHNLTNSQHKLAGGSHLHVVHLFYYLFVTQNVEGNPRTLIQPTECSNQTTMYSEHIHALQSWLFTSIYQQWAGHHFGYFSNNILYLQFVYYNQTLRIVEHTGWWFIFRQNEM